MTEHRHPREIPKEIHAMNTVTLEGFANAGPDGFELPNTGYLFSEERFAELERLLRHASGSIGCGCNPCSSCKKVSKRIDAALAAAPKED